MTTNRSFIRLALIAVLAAMSTMTMAQDKQFTLEDLNFGGNNYRNMIPRNMYLTWWGEKLIYQDVEDFGTIDIKTGKKTSIATNDDITKALDGDTLRSCLYIQCPYPGKTLVLAKTSRQRLLYDWKKKTVVWNQICKDESHSDWNSVSRAVAYVDNNQLWVADAQGNRQQVTTDGSREIVYAQSVHRNEFGIYKGTFWSPNGKRLAFYRMDQTMVTDYPQVNTFAREAEHMPDKYPMAGMTSHKVTVGIYDIDTKKTIWVDAGDPTDRYFTNISWSPDGKTIYMIDVNRDQTDSWLSAYDATTGKKIRTLIHDHHDKYVHPMTPITFLPWDNRYFVMLNDRDGYNHLYLYDIEGNMVRQITQGKWNALQLLGFNTKKKSAIILSTEASDIQNNLYAVSIDNGKRTPLDNGKGLHARSATTTMPSSALSASGSMVIDSWQEPDVPRNIAIVSTDNGKGTTIFKADNPWQGYKVPDYSCGTIKADDDSTTLYYRMVKPVDFDPNKKYPTIVYVYGGPGVRNVEAGWHYNSRSWETYMAQKGYLLFILDNRGSSDRGREFEQITFRHLGQEEMKDQMRGVEFLKSLPYVDADRLGVNGWSYGGFMTISLMTHYPDVFKVGVAGGPVIDWKWYEVMYGERYMDTPQDNPEGYKQTSLIEKAGNLKGRLQIIIGMNDDVVVPQHALMFLNACSEKGTQPDFYVYPGEGHNMMGHKSVHLHERITRYFDDYLK